MVENRWLPLVCVWLKLYGIPREGWCNPRVTSIEAQQAERAAVSSCPLSRQHVPSKHISLSNGPLDHVLSTGSAIWASLLAKI